MGPVAQCPERDGSELRIVLSPLMGVFTEKVFFYICRVFRSLEARVMRCRITLGGALAKSNATQKKKKFDTHTAG